MRLTQALIALVVTGLANAQIPNVPSCSLQCFLSSLTNDGCSDLTDFACHCAKPQLPKEITPCVEKACSEADQSGAPSFIHLATFNGYKLIRNSRLQRRRPGVLRRRPPHLPPPRWRQRWPL